jgi:cap1 methyltransferase
MDSNASSDDFEEVSPQNKRKLSEAHSDTTTEDEIYTMYDNKKPKLDFGEMSNYSDVSKRMMQKMGFSGNKGLGRTSQGRLEPVEASIQKGRRGLGMRLDDLEAAAVNWNPEMEKIDIPEPIDWLYNLDEDLPDRDTLCHWTVCGEEKLTIDDENLFCDSNILLKVLESKSIFDNLGSDDMRRARTKSNPFEKIRNNIFLNRAAVKMANMDSMFDFMFTEPRDENDLPLVREEQLLYFADVCAGPGGT